MLLVCGFEQQRVADGGRQSERGGEPPPDHRRGERIGTNLLQQRRGGLAALLVYAHVERVFELHREAARGIVELQRRRRSHFLVLDGFIVGHRLVEFHRAEDGITVLDVVVSRRAPTL